jgi:hypothetical protein
MCTERNNAGNPRATVEAHWRVSALKHCAAAYALRAWSREQVSADVAAFRCKDSLEG